MLRAHGLIGALASSPHGRDFIGKLVETGLHVGLGASVEFKPGRLGQIRGVATGARIVDGLAVALKQFPVGLGFGLGSRRGGQLAGGGQLGVQRRRFRILQLLFIPLGTNEGDGGRDVR